MTSPQLPTLQAPPSSDFRPAPIFDWSATRRRVLRVPLGAKVLGANMLIALAAVGAAAAGGHASVVAIVSVALAISFLLNTLLVRLALAPLAELENAAERVSHGEWYVRVAHSPLADRRVDRLAMTINRLLDTVSADQQHIHKLIQRSLGMRELERETLSRQLREETAQALCGLDLQLGAAERDFGVERGLLALQAARGISSQTLDQVRGLADTIYPGLLQELGLSAALDALTARVRNRTTLQVSVDTARATTHMSPSLILTMYHVAEEAVRNAERHAHARSIEIRLSSTPTTLRLDVSDDGNGFDPASIERDSPAVGLFQLREMLSNVHGELKIESAPRCGTRITATARLDQGDTA